MAADFPDNPNVNDTFTVGDRSWIWNGTTWDAAVEEVLSADAPITFNSSTRTVGLDQAGVQNGRNYIINGAFDINQREATSVTANGDYIFDRWNIGLAGATVTATSETFTSGEIEAIGFGDVKNYVSVETSGGSGTTQNTQLRTPMEDVRILSGQEATLSFWAKADSGTPKVALEVAQVFDGSSPVRTYGGNVTISTSWERYSLTFTIPSVSGKTIGASSFLQMTIWTSGGSAFDSRTGSIGIQNNTISFWGVQLEAGSVATPFKRNANSIQGELAACQRYYYRFSTAVQGGGGGYQYATAGPDRHASSGGFPVTMRTAPSLSVVSGGVNNLNNCSSPSFESTDDGFQVRVTVTSTGMYRAFQDLETSGAELY